LRRPYMKLRIGDLTDIVEDPGTSPEVRRLVAEELSHRASPAARRLLARIGDDSVPPKVGTSRGVVSGRSAVRADEPGSARLPTEPMAPHVLEREAVLAALRETYSEGSELLAKWGMTTAIPEELYEVVIAWWSKSVSETQDRFGRSTTSLAEDMDKVRMLGLFGGNGEVSVD